MQNIIERINETGDKIFLNPRPVLSYYELAQKSLSSNTYRGFHRIDKTKPGSKPVFENLFLNEKEEIIQNLKEINNEKDLNIYSNLLCKKLQKKLRTNIKPKQLTSFNKLWKPIDIVTEHFVSMGKNFTDCRSKLIQSLFLPLDSQMFQSEFVFSEKEIKDLKIKRSFTFKDIQEENQYLEIQSFLNEKANRLGLEARIYFDLIWNNRFQSDGRNLFETNP